MTQPANTHTSGSDSFWAYDSADLTGSTLLAPGVLTDAKGHILDGRTRVATQSPTISAAAIYAAGDAVGGLLTFASVVESADSAASLVSVTVIDKDPELAALDLVLFDQTFTATADNAAFAPSDADLANCIGWVSITPGHYANFSTNAVAVVRNVGLGIKLTGTSLFGQLVARGTPTYTATSDLKVHVAVKAD